jgi:carbon monoxide dehydrogenase subunit G
MSEISNFESRTGKLSCSALQAFNFFTDLRNFKRFIPGKSISDLVVEADSCSFHVDMLGMVRIHISDKVCPGKIVYSGVVPQVKDISMTVDIRDDTPGHSEAKLHIRAEINPFLRMMATEPIKKVLATIIDEMERFRDWGGTT